jgi:glucose-6-phosphate 1-epimerase
MHGPPPAAAAACSAAGRPASTPASTSGTCPPARRQRRRGAGAGSRRTSSSSTAASALDEAAAAAATSSSGGGDAGPADIAAATAEYLQHCQQHYGKQGLIEFSAGAGGLPKATLQHPGGARAELYLHGAAVTSWQHSDGREMLHVREGNAFDGQEPIR